MIRVYKLWKQYGDAPPVIQNLSLHVDKGEFVFLTGPSGSGKSTLLKVLIGEEKPSSGQVVIGGKDVGAMTASQIPYLRRTVGFVFQDFKLLPHRTALENVALVLKISGLSPGEQRIRAIKAIRRVGLEHRMHYDPAMLSGGEQQRIAIARAVVNDPALLLADEPTGNLDPALSLDILNIFREINARGTTVVVATHDPRLIGEVKRRVIYLTSTGGPGGGQDDDDFLDAEIGVSAAERAAAAAAAASAASADAPEPATAGATAGSLSGGKSSGAGSGGIGSGGGGAVGGGGGGAHGIKRHR
jgi:cell division transport system ATP-binding protein